MIRSRLAVHATRWANGSCGALAALGVAIVVVQCGIAAAQDTPAGKASQKNSKDSGKPIAPAVKLIEGERVKPDDVMILVRSSLLEEGEAVEQIAANEANLNNVRYNIGNYPIGYAVGGEKQQDKFVFVGPTKGWRALTTKDVSIWPPSAFIASRRETMRQAKLIEPIVLAEPCDEINHLRVFFRPLPVGHDGNQYVEEPTALAFFVHPDSGKRMTVLYRKGQSHTSIGEPLVALAKVYIQEVTRGRDNSTLVPTVFYSKEVSIETEQPSEAESLNRLMHAVIDARAPGTLAVADFKALFAELSRQTGGVAEPAAGTASASTHRK